MALLLWGNDKAQGFVLLWLLTTEGGGLPHGHGGQGGGEEVRGRFIELRSEVMR